MPATTIGVPGGDLGWADDSGAAPPLVLPQPGVGDSCIRAPLPPPPHRVPRPIRDVPATVSP